MITRFLFETDAGARLLAALEHRLNVAICTRPLRIRSADRLADTTYRLRNPDNDLRSSPSADDVFTAAFGPPTWAIDETTARWIDDLADSQDHEEQQGAP